MADDPIQVLFVCMGNICRSPAAECILRRKLQELGLADAVRVDSAGTIGFHAGNPPDPRMRQAGQPRGLTIEGRARQFAVGDFDAFDLVVAMDAENLSDLERLSRHDEDRAKLRPFKAFCRNFVIDGVPDPYYGGNQGFDRVLDILDDGCDQIAAWVQNRMAGHGSAAGLT